MGGGTRAAPPGFPNIKPLTIELGATILGWRKSSEKVLANENHWGRRGANKAKTRGQKGGGKATTDTQRTRFQGKGGTRHSISFNQQDMKTGTHLLLKRRRKNRGEGPEDSPCNQSPKGEPTEEPAMWGGDLEPTTQSHLRSHAKAKTKLGCPREEGKVGETRAG